MKRSKEWLEQKINKLNEWLMNHGSEHFQYKLKEQNRNYYVKKLIELEDNQLETIKI